ncbi:MAG TPA: hypothetical protein VKM54_09510 [Myxococcota bacterium]|nr:hypothetical protein [Myxococcota bacterium]
MAARARLLWVDALKGIAILWIAYFHFFKAWANERYPAPFNPYPRSSPSARPRGPRRRRRVRAR